MVTEQRGSYKVNPKAGGGRGIPPLDLYTLQLVDIVELKMGQAFEGEDPKLQFTLEFAILDYDDPATGEPMLIRGWYTPKLHAIEGYQEPKLYKLVKAMNGGEPHSLPVDENGEVEEYDAWEELETYVGSGTFRATVGPNQKGWARITGDPLPVRVTKRPKMTAKVVEQVDQETGESTDGGNGAIDTKF